MVICYLGVGSNLGNRRKNINSAIEKISALKETRVIKISKIIETKPVGGPSGQGRYLNAALKIKTNLAPLDLLKKLSIIEKELGRNRGIPNGPRTIDLDILFYGGRIINKKNLVIPHPRMLQRKFVLVPLMELLS